MILVDFDVWMSLYIFDRWDSWAIAIIKGPDIPEEAYNGNWIY